MTSIDARRWLVSASLLVSALAFVFFLVAPAIGYPLTWDQAIRVVEIVLPVFLGYLGTAARYIFRPESNMQLAAVSDRHLMALLIRAPIIVFILAGGVVCFSFGYSNRQDATPGAGMTVDTLCWAFTTLLGLLAATTGVAVSFLFSAGTKDNQTPQEYSVVVQHRPE